jgi:hypothetical protein
MMRPWQILGCAISAAALSSSAQAHADSLKAFSVPFELYKGHIYVHAFVNGQGPYRFVFDTGASGIGRADTRLVKELSLRVTGQEQNSDGINVAPITMVAADSVRLGGLEKRDVILASRDYNVNRKPSEAPVMGIIGRDFFTERLLTIDYPARKIILSRGSLSARQRGVVAYKPSFSIPVCFKAGCFEGEVDSGSNRSLIIPKALVGLVEASAPVRIGSGTSANTSFELYEMQLAQPVRISGVTATNQKILYSEPSDDTINIGSDFLKDYVLTIDQRHRLLRISKPKR